MWQMLLLLYTPARILWWCTSRHSTYGAVKCGNGTPYRVLGAVLGAFEVAFCVIAPTTSAMHLGLSASPGNC